MRPRVVLAIARKDLLDAVKNMYILSALVLPIVLSLLFRLAFGGLGQSASLTTIVVYDPGNSSLSAALRAVPDLKVLDAPSLDALSGEVAAQAVAGIDVPVGFDAALKAGAKPALGVYVNRGRGGGEIAYFNRLLEEQVRALAGQEMPVELTTTGVGGGALGQASFGSLDLDSFLLVTLLVLAIAMAGAFAVPTLLVEEKEKHTLEVLLISPASPADVVLGKGLVGLAYCGLGSLILMALNDGLKGAWPLTILAILVGSAFAVLVGLLIGGLFRTTSQVNTWSSVVMMVLILPTWFVSMAPSSPLTAVFRAIPTFYLAEALSATLAGSPDLGRLALNLGIVAACALAALVGVVWLVRREDR